MAFFVRYAKRYIQEYSNSGYMLLAEIVNRASGMTIREYARENIFEPLGMKNTFFNDNHKQITKNRVISYQSQGDGTYERFLQNFDALGDGNLLTTVNDLYLWDQNFYTQSVGGKEFKDIIFSRGVLNNGDTLEYAFGQIHEQYNGLKAISHGGAMLGFRTEYVRFPDQRFSVIVLANRSDADATQKAFQISDIFIKDKFIDTFTADIGLLRFNKSNGVVKSFQLDAIGMTNLKFEKK